MTGVNMTTEAKIVGQFKPQFDGLKTKPVNGRIDGYPARIGWFCMYTKQGKKWLQDFVVLVIEEESGVEHVLSARAVCPDVGKTAPRLTRMETTFGTLQQFCKYSHRLKDKR
jgi:hypothetical protein